MDVDHEPLGETLHRAYGIAPSSIVDAPRGFVAETFDVRASDGRRFFVKWLPRWGDAAAVLRSLPVLEELHAQGIDTVSHPVRTRTGDLAVALDERPLIVFDFVEGRSGHTFPYDFQEYVSLLARIHQATALVTAPVPREEFHLPWAAQFEHVFAHMLRQPPSTAPRVMTQQLMERHREQIERDWATLAALARSCREAVWTPLLTHGDGLGDNVIAGDDGRLYLIDWDEILLAPAERDTWFFLNEAAPSTARFLQSDVAQATAFLQLYRKAVPDYRPDPLRYRFYLFARFFQDLLGYLINIVESPSLEQQRWNLAELEETCFRWLWPPMRSASPPQAWPAPGTTAL